MKKKVLSMVLAAVLMLNLAACAGQESGTTGETADTQESSSDGETADAAEDSAETPAEDLTFGVTVSFITGYYSAMIDGINETAEEMGIEIVLLNAESDSTKQAQ